MKYILIAKDDITIYDENNKFLYKLVYNSGIFRVIFSLYDRDNNLIFRYNNGNILSSFKILYQNVGKEIYVRKRMGNLNLLYDDKIIRTPFFSFHHSAAILINNQKSAFYKLTWKNSIAYFSINIDSKYKDSSIPILLFVLMKLSYFEREKKIRFYS